MMDARQIGIRRNKLLRYRRIKELYLQHKTEDIPTTVVWRKYINPFFPCSRTTLYEALGTAINAELKKLEALEKEIKEKNQQLQLNIGQA